MILGRFRWRRLTVIALRLGLIGLAAWFFLAIVTGVDWAKVGSALTELTALQAVALLLLLIPRIVLNAYPLSRFVPGLPLRRAVPCDLNGSVLVTFAPTPSDIMLRLSMFRSWNVDVTLGVAGMVLNSVVYYTIRFAAPVIGFFLILAGPGFDSRFAAAATVGGVIAAGLVVILVAVLRAERVAAATGRLAGRLAHRVRPGAVDPGQWERQMVQFRGTVEERARAGWRRSAPAILGMLLAESVLFLVAVRFMGVPASAISAVEVTGCFCLTYALSVLPLSGLGVLDTALAGLLVSYAGSSHSSAITAALVLWRIYTLLIPFALGGLGVLVWWRHRDVPAPAADDPISPQAPRHGLHPRECDD